MDFGTMGRRMFFWLLLLSATAVMAQGEAACVLPMVAPDSLTVTTELQSTSRGPGMVLTWPEPDDASSTCVALADTAGLGIPMIVTGDYGDDLDRTLEFTFITDGTVGDTGRNRFVCYWINANNARTGNLGGEINLSNTGGLWVQDSAGDWSQRNGGLPFYLPYTNLADVSRADDGTLVMALSSGAQVQNDPVGVYVASSDGDWAEVGTDLFSTARKTTKVAVDPTDAQKFAVGTRTDGVFITTDGGATFTQFDRDLDPDAGTFPLNYEVTALAWTANRLYVAVRSFGMFISTDDGATFVRQDGLDVPAAPRNDEDTVVPEIDVILEDPADNQRILVGMTNHGVWQTTNGGSDWASILVDYEGPDENWTVTVLSLVIDPADGDHIIAGTEAQLIRETTDGGTTWTDATTPYDGLIVLPAIHDLVIHDGQFLALANGELQSGSPNIGILESAAGSSWALMADQPFNSRARCLVSADDELLLPTVGGGIFRAPSTVPLVETIDPGTTDSELMDIDLGLSITFGEGAVDLIDEDGDGIDESRTFRMVCQDYQGWIVWRAPRGDRDSMVMIGRYDKNNPETCIQGYCGDENYVLLPNCFSERRAACFDFSVPGQVSFYDDDVFNGFSYYYAITPFDFGDISTIVDPVSIDSPMVFPNRYPGDVYGNDESVGNRFAVEINSQAAAAEDGEEIYAYPNPLRLGSGIVGGEGQEVIWTNLPPDSRIQIFTLAGDEIAELPEDAIDGEQVGGNIHWLARNRSDEDLASGIYIWKVIMPQRGDFWGKLVIIK